MPYCISLQNLPAQCVQEDDTKMMKHWFINDDVQPPTRQPITESAMEANGLVLMEENANVDTCWNPEQLKKVFEYVKIPWVFDAPTSTSTPKNELEMIFQAIQQKFTKFKEKYEEYDTVVNTLCKFQGEGYNVADAVEKVKNQKNELLSEEIETMKKLQLISNQPI
mgnify:CR=1 FL=1